MGLSVNQVLPRQAPACSISACSVMACSLDEEKHFGLLIMQQMIFNALMSLGWTAHISQCIGFGNRETKISQVMYKIA